MYETLINLYTGNLGLIKPQTNFPLKKHYQREYDKLKKQLNNLLNEDSNKLLEKLLEVSSLESGYSNYDSFITGYRIATLIMTEVYHNKDSLFENREQYLRHFIHRPYVGTPSPIDDLED